MAGTTRVTREAPARARDAAVVVLPRARSHGPYDLARLLPSARSLLVAFAIVAVAAGGYLIVRSTSVFAVDTVDVEGAPAPVAIQVKNALRGDLGTNLLRLDLDRVRQEVAAVPTVASATFDRAFPHTLRVVVVPERPVAVVRQGADSWLVSARGRVLAHLRHGGLPQLPRIWVARGPVFALGGMAPATLHEPLAAVSPLLEAGFKARVASVRAASDELTLVLRSGIEIRLGDATDVPVKLAVARRVLPLVASDTRYVDVSVPERPVAGAIFHAPLTTTGGGATAADGAAAAAGSGTTGASPTLKSQLEVDGAGSTTP